MELTKFRFWCQKVLPLVYDDSLSYYEVLCKVVDYLNNTISAVNETTSETNELKKEVDVVQDWIANYNTAYAEEIIRETLASMIFLEISDSGYIVYYIPDSWTDVNFNTTGLDITVAGYPEYGRLVLTY